MPTVVTPNAVRRALDVTLDANVLPDDVVNLDIYAGRALREVNLRLAGLTLDADGQKRADAAANFITASMLALAVGPQIGVVHAANGGGNPPSVDWKEASAELRQRAESELQLIIGGASVDDVRASMPTVFTLASGTRGL